MDDTFSEVLKSIFEDKNIFDLIDELRDESLSRRDKLYFDITGDIAGRLLVYRKKHKLTQRELAKKLEVPFEYIQGIEAGVVNLSIKELVDIAVKLGGSLKIELDV